MHDARTAALLICQTLVLGVGCDDSPRIERRMEFEGGEHGIRHIQLNEDVAVELEGAFGRLSSDDRATRLRAQGEAMAILATFFSAIQPDLVDGTLPALVARRLGEHRFAQRNAEVARSVREMEEAFWLIEGLDERIADSLRKVREIVDLGDAALAHERELLDRERRRVVRLRVIRENLIMLKADLGPPPENFVELGQSILEQASLIDSERLGSEGFEVPDAPEAVREDG